MARGLLLGTVLSRKTGDTVRRQSAAQASLAALAPLGVDGVTVTFATDGDPGYSLRVLSKLTLDSTRVSGVDGPAKPLVSEVLDVLAAEAQRRGLDRIGVVNGDIIVLPQAIERLASIGRPAVAIGRTDIGGGQPDANLLHGVDMFVFDRAYWERERRRFRAYLLGEPVWDNVYASVVCCHGGVLLNRERLILHERHAADWKASPFAHYVHHLATRDRSYFSVWCAYVGRAEALRAAGGSAADEYALQQEVFKAPGPLAEFADRGRAAWWRLKGRLRA